MLGINFSFHIMMVIPVACIVSQLLTKHCCPGKIGQPEFMTWQERCCVVPLLWCILNIMLHVHESYIVSTPVWNISQMILKTNYQWENKISDLAVQSGMWLANNKKTLKKCTADVFPSYKWKIKQAIKQYPGILFGSYIETTSQNENNIQFHHVTSKNCSGSYVCCTIRSGPLCRTRFRWYLGNLNV